MCELLMAAFLSLHILRVEHSLDLPSQVCESSAHVVNVWADDGCGGQAAWQP